jgi:hypothetical protein
LTARDRGPSLRLALSDLLSPDFAHLTAAFALLGSEGRTTREGAASKSAAPAEEQPAGALRALK